MAAESQISFIQYRHQTGISEFEYDDGCARMMRMVMDMTMFCSGSIFCGYNICNQAAYDSGFVDGAGSITPEDGIGQRC